MNKKKWRNKFCGKDSRRWLKYHSPQYSAPKLNPNWERKVINALLDYPRLQAELHEVRKDRHGQPKDRRPVELALTWSLPRKEQRAYDAVSAAIQEMKRQPHGNTATKIIKYRYWSGSSPVPSLQAAATAVDTTLGRARQLDFMFKGAVARHMGHIIRKRGDGRAR